MSDAQAVEKLVSLAWGCRGAGPTSAAVCAPFPPGVPSQSSTFPPGHMPPKENGLWRWARVDHFLASCDGSLFQEVSSAGPQREHLLPTADALHLMASSWPSRNRKQTTNVSLSLTGHSAPLYCAFQGSIHTALRARLAPSRKAPAIWTFEAISLTSLSLGRLSSASQPWHVGPEKFLWSLAWCDPG